MISVFLGMPAVAEFAWHLIPRYPGLEHKQDRRQGRAIADTWPSALRRSAVSREMTCCVRPKVFGEKCLGHGISPSGNTAAILATELRPCKSDIEPLRTLTAERLISVA